MFGSTAAINGAPWPCQKPPWGFLTAINLDTGDFRWRSVLGVVDELKGQVPVGLVVLKAGSNRDPADLERELIQMVRDEIGAIAVFKRAVVVERLPKTRSGKILRGTMRAIADGREYRVPSTIDDPAILDEVRIALGILV